MDAINEWYRSGIKKELKPKIIKKIDLISQDQRKVYYDFLKLEHKNIYDFPISFISKSDAINWLDTSFLADNNEYRLQNYFLKVLGEVELIILKGHNHQYMEDVTLFISRKNTTLFEGNVIENADDFDNYRDWIFINSIFH